MRLLSIKILTFLQEEVNMLKEMQVLPNVIDLDLSVTQDFFMKISGKKNSFLV
jgi:hypothetical protein